jgi:hypothetical protein
MSRVKALMDLRARPRHAARVSTASAETPYRSVSSWVLGESGKSTVGGRSRAPISNETLISTKMFVGFEMSNSVISKS